MHAKVVDDYLANEVSRRRVASPFCSPPLQPLHISSFGILPKKGKLGKWKLTVDFSFPGWSGRSSGGWPRVLYPLLSLLQSSSSPRRAFLTHGLASSTPRSYTSVQNKFWFPLP